MYIVPQICIFRKKNHLWTKLCFPHDIHMEEPPKKAYFRGFGINIHKGGVVNILSYVNNFVKNFFHVKKRKNPQKVDNLYFLRPGKRT